MPDDAFVERDRFWWVRGGAQRPMAGEESAEEKEERKSEGFKEVGENCSQEIECFHWWAIPKLTTSYNISWYQLFLQSIATKISN